MDPNNIEDVKKFVKSYKDIKPSKASELYILGLLSHMNLGGYDIFKLIEKTADTSGGLVRVNKATVYNTLNRMEKDRLIEIVKTIKDPKRPPKSIYSIADKGKEYLKELVLQDFSNPPFILVNFVPALFFSRVLSKEELKEVIATKIEQVEFITEVNKNVAKMDLGDFSNSFMIFKNDMYRSLLDYLKNLLKLVETKPLDKLFAIKALTPEKAVAEFEKHFKEGLEK
jgi:DNA-binding PadR family transcriptional regulator